MNPASHPGGAAEDSGDRAGPAAPPARAAILAAGGVLVLLTLAAYHGSFGGPFLFDDRDSILANPTIRRLWPPWAALAPPAGTTVHDRPLLNLSFALNYALSGTSPWSYHALNLLIHLLAGLTLFGLVRRAFGSPALRGRFAGSALPVAFFSALLWMLHPVQTQSVTYVVQRAESLMGLFYLLTLYGFCRGAHAEGGGRAAPRWFALSWLACLCGMATKETMVTAPFAVLLYDRTFASGTFRESWRRHRRLFLSLAATWLMFTPIVLAGGRRDPTSGFGDGIPFWGYARTQFHAVAHYLRVSLWPRSLLLYYERGGHIDYAHPPGTASVALYAALVLPLVAATAYALVRRPVLGFAGAWFFGILAPTSLVPGASDVMADRRLYLPLAALAVLLVGGLYARAGRRSIPLLLAAAAALGWGTARRNRVFASELALWREQALARPDDPLARLNLGNALYFAGRIDEAIAQYKRALDIDPGYVDALLGAGIALAQEGRYAESIADFEWGLAVAPNRPGAARRIPDLEANLGLDLVRDGRPLEAIAPIREALRFEPGQPDLHNDLGVALDEAGYVPEAAREFEAALKLDPHFAVARQNLARLSAAPAP